MGATLTKRRPRPAVSAPEAPLLTPYATYVPPLDAPPLSAFWACHCGAVLVERIWHNRTDEREAHWEICDPPVTAVLRNPHTQEACAQTMAEPPTPSPGATEEGVAALLTGPCDNPIDASSIAEETRETKTNTNAPARRERPDGGADVEDKY